MDQCVVTWDDPCLSRLHSTYLASKALLLVHFVRLRSAASEFNVSAHMAEIHFHQEKETMRLN